MGQIGHNLRQGAEPEQIAQGAASSCSCLGRQRGDAPAKQPACQPSTDGGASLAAGAFTPAAKRDKIQDTEAQD